MFKKYRFNLIASVLFLVLLFIVFHEFAFDSSKLMLNSDQLNGIGTRELRAENLILTEWDDARLGGVPTIDALYADAYHPLVLVQFITDPARAVGFKFILTIWVAFISAMLLAFSLTGNRAGSALLGFLYAFSPQYFSMIYGGHDGKMMVFAAAPLAILAISKVIREGSIKYFIVLVCSIVWMILGSHLQLTYFFLWGAGFYALYETLALRKSVPEQAKKLGLAAFALALALAISAFQLIPPYLYTTQQSVRGSDEKTTIGHAVSWSLHQEELASMLIPGFVGVDVYTQSPETGELKAPALLKLSYGDYRNYGSAYWGHNSFKLNHESSGILLTFLAFLCFFIPGKRRWATFWTLGAAIALSYGMGANSPFFGIWYELLPGVKNFRAPSMVTFWMPLIALMMAAPVLKAALQPDSKKYLTDGLVSFGILAGILLIARFYWDAFLGPVGFIVSLAYGLFFIGVMNLHDRGETLNFSRLMNAFKKGLSGTPRSEQIFMFIPFVIIGLFFWMNQTVVDNPEIAQYFKPLNYAIMKLTAVQVIPGFIILLLTITLARFWLTLKTDFWKIALGLAFIASVDLFTVNAPFVQNVEAGGYKEPNHPVIRSIKAQNPENTPRVLSLSRTNSLTGNIFPAYQLRNADGFHDNELATSRAFRGGQSNANYLEGVPVNQIPQRFNGPEWNAASAVLTAMPVVKIYHKTAVMNPEQILEALGRADSAWKTTAFIESPLSFPLDSTATDSVISIEGMDTHTQTIKVKSSAAALLVVARSDHPYWRAKINGEKKPVLRAFGTYRAIEIPAGESEITFEYGSPFLDLMNIGSIIFDTRTNTGASTVYLPNAGAIGEAKLYGNFEIMEDSAAILALKNGFDYTEKIILDRKPAIAENQGIPNGSIKLVSHPKMDSYLFEAVSDKPAFVLFSGNYHPYWKASVNGKETPVYKAFGTLRAIEIPAGKSTAELMYRSDAFHRSLRISLIAALIFVGFSVIWWIRRKGK
ncbi:MAG: hypothetical protein LBR60_01795 [Fibrobacter sp.]|jgi:hypothetical protein|nr:hypothetical protein [Fibrobacter sp.]